MKRTHWLIILAIALLFSPNYVGATLVYETTGFISGNGADISSFVANQSPYTYQATLADLSVSPGMGFNLLFLSITTTTSTSDILGFTIGPGSFSFDVVAGETYNVNVVGDASGTTQTGIFGVQINTVPIPPALLLLGAGFIGIVGLRRKIYG